MDKSTFLAEYELNRLSGLADEMSSYFRKMKKERTRFEHD